MADYTESTREYYAMFTAEIDHKNRVVILELHRYRNPVQDSQVEKLREWTLRCIEVKYPDYKVVSNG